MNHRALRIVNIVTQMEGGGAQAAAIQIAAELRRRGHLSETWFLYLKRPTYVGEEGVRVMFDSQRKKLADYLYIFMALNRQLRIFNPDGVITYTHYANGLGQISALLAGVPARVASQHNPAWTYPRMARYLDWAIGSLGVYTTNIAVSRSVCESFANYPKSYLSRLQLVYNGIYLRESSLSQIEARIKFGLPQSVPLAINVGRLAYQKNQQVLLKAICWLPNVHLAIAGDGELREELRQQVLTLGIGERVHFLGEISPSDIADFLRTGDIFAFPSHFEAFGLALIEAMSAGLPVIASDIPALKEVLGGVLGISPISNLEEGHLPEDIIESQPAGLLIPPSDDRAWAEAIQKVLDCDKLRGALSVRDRQRAALFSLEKMTDDYESSIQNFSR